MDHEKKYDLFNTGSEYVLPQDSFVSEEIYNNGGNSHTYVDGILWNNAGYDYDAGCNAGYFKKGTVFKNIVNGQYTFSHLFVVPLK